MASVPQSGDWLENWGSKDDEVSGRVWEAVETKAGKVGMAEVEGGREKREKGKKWEERKDKKKKEKKKDKKPKKLEVWKIVEEWEIWNEEEEAAKLEVEAKKLVPEKFYKWIHIFGKKASEWMPTKKL